MARHNEHESDDSCGPLLDVEQSHTAEEPRTIDVDSITGISCVSITELFTWRDQSVNVTARERMYLRGIIVRDLVCIEEELACSLLDRLENMDDALEGKHHQDMTILGLRWIARKMVHERRSNPPSDSSVGLGLQGESSKDLATEESETNLDDKELKELMLRYTCALVRASASEAWSAGRSSNEPWRNPTTDAPWKMNSSDRYDLDVQRQQQPIRPVPREGHVDDEACIQDKDRGSRKASDPVHRQASAEAIAAWSKSQASTDELADARPKEGDQMPNVSRNEDSKVCTSTRKDSGPSDSTSIEDCRDHYGGPLRFLTQTLVRFVNFLIRGGGINKNSTVLEKVTVTKAEDAGEEEI